MSYYSQHQQYYEHLRRTNPQAYMEWYNKYMASLQAHQLHSRDPTIAGEDVAVASMHSGYSSDKERYVEDFCFRCVIVCCLVGKSKFSFLVYGLFCLNYFGVNLHVTLIFNWFFSLFFGVWFWNLEVLENFGFMGLFYSISWNFRFIEVNFQGLKQLNCEINENSLIQTIFNDW